MSIDRVREHLYGKVIPIIMYDDDGNNRGDLKEIEVEGILHQGTYIPQLESQVDILETHECITHFYLVTRVTQTEVQRDGGSVLSIPIGDQITHWSWYVYDRYLTYLDTLPHAYSLLADMVKDPSKFSDRE